MTQQWKPTGGRFDVEPLENINEVADLPDLAQLDEAQIYSIRSGNFAPDYVVPWAWDSAEGEYQEWRSTVDGQAIIDIPDSVVAEKEIHSYPVTEFTESSWPDAIGESNIDTISGPTLMESDFGGQGGVVSDGDDGYVQSDTMGDFGSNLTGSWAVVVPFSTEDNSNIILGVDNENDDTLFGISIGRSMPDNKIGINVRDNSGNFQRFHGTPDINDGNEYVCILQSVGNSASDKEIYFEPDSDVSSIEMDDGDLGTTSNFEFPMTYFARVIDGSIDQNIAASINTPRWYNDSLTESERSDVFDAYDWYDPSTDAPS